jgi:hypothetical protein
LLEAAETRSPVPSASRLFSLQRSKSHANVMALIAKRYLHNSRSRMPRIAAAPVEILGSASWAAFRVKSLRSSYILASHYSPAARNFTLSILPSPNRL